MYKRGHKSCIIKCMLLMWFQIPKEISTNLYTHFKSYLINNINGLNHHQWSLAKHSGSKISKWCSKRSKTMWSRTGWGIRHHKEKYLFQKRKRRRSDQSRAISPYITITNKNNAITQRCHHNVWVQSDFKRRQLEWQQSPNQIWLTGFWAQYFHFQ